MIAFRRKSWLAVFLCAVSPRYRRRRDEPLRQAIAELVADPGLPCVIEGRLVPHGYGEKHAFRELDEHG